MDPVAPPLKELFQHLARLSGEPLLGVSPEGDVVLSCLTANRLLGRSEQEVQSRLLTELAADPATKVQDYLRLCSRSLVPLPGALNILDADGRLVPCRCKAALLSPPPAAPIILVRLIPREGAQSPFSLLNQKIADLTREVMIRKRAEQEALQAIEIRDEFLAVASHEFKTPLHSLMLQLELVSRALSTVDAFTHQRLSPKLRTMRRHVDRLAKLSTGLLDLSSLRSGQVSLELERHDVAAIIRASVDAMSVKVEQAGCRVRLDLEPGLAAIVDGERLRQILMNLLGNAAKYGAGMPIGVSSRSEGDRVSIAVRDGGIGIAAEDLARIFGKFERAVSAENYGGLGLGLFISRQLAEAMDGTLRAESIPDRGSTFTLEFKKARAWTAAVEQ